MRTFNGTHTHTHTLAHIQQCVELEKYEKIHIHTHTHQVYAILAGVEHGNSKNGDLVSLFGNQYKYDFTIKLTHSQQASKREGKQNGLANTRVFVPYTTHYSRKPKEKEKGNLSCAFSLPSETMTNELNHIMTFEKKRRESDTHKARYREI